MADEKFMLVSLDDPKMKSLSEVFGNKTCKRIIDYLAENEEASQKDLSDALDMPINTVEYNIKKLIESGLIQKRKNFFWSKKGKKIVMYELSNKSIVISPRKSAAEKFKSLIPAFMLTLVGTFAIWVYEKLHFASSDLSNSVSDSVMQKGVEVAVSAPSLAYDSANQVARTTVNHASDVFSTHPSPLWMAFLGGALLVLLIVSIVNWRKL